MKTNTIQLSSKNAFICQVPYKRIHTYSKSLARLNQGQHKRLAEEKHKKPPWKTQEAPMEQHKKPRWNNTTRSMEQRKEPHGNTRSPSLACAMEGLSEEGGDLLSRIAVQYHRRARA